MLPEAAERELARAAVRGDNAALGKLLMDSDKRLRGYLQRRFDPVRDAIDLMDVVQEAYSAAFRDIASFEYRGPGSFFAWLKTIANRRLLSMIREAGRKKRGGDHRRIELGSDPNDSAIFLLDQLKGKGETPSVSLAREEAAQAMHVAVGSLPDDYRRAIQIRYFEGHSVAETADELGQTPNAVRGRLDRAKRKLRRLLGELGVMEKQKD